MICSSAATERGRAVGLLLSRVELLRPLALRVRLLTIPRRTRSRELLMRRGSIYPGAKENSNGLVSIICKD